MTTQNTLWRTFRVVRREALSTNVTGLMLYPTDGGTIPSYLPGQGVSIRATLADAGLVTSHPFAITHASDPDNLTLTIAVERQPGDLSSEGRLCNWLESEVRSGDILEVGLPTGDFTLDTKEELPLVFLADRLGFAPFLAMVDALSFEHPTRPVTVLYQTTDGEHFPFEGVLRHIVSRMPRAKLGVFFSKPLDTDEERKHYDVEGEIDIARQKDLAFVDNADYWIAGPEAFVEKNVAALVALGVIPSRIHAEVVVAGSTR